MDGGACPLYGAAELERQDAHYQTQQGHGQPYLCYQYERKGMLEEMTCQTLRCVIIYSIMCVLFSLEGSSSEHKTVVRTQNMEYATA